MQRTAAGSATNSFDQIAASTSEAWVTLQGQYTFSTDIASNLLLYIESTTAKHSYSDYDTPRFRCRSSRQGQRYRDIFEAFRNLKGKITNVTLWGLADDNTWLKDPSHHAT